MLSLASLSREQAERSLHVADQSSGGNRPVDTSTLPAGDAA